MTLGITADLEAAARRVSAWCGEPLLHEGENADSALAPGTARRAALDAAIAEMDRGLVEPSFAWRRDFSLILGLDRMLSGQPPRLASGTALRRHQVDALAGQLAALIADRERGEGEEDEEDDDEGNGNGNGNGNGDENGDDHRNDAGFDVAVAHVAPVHELEADAPTDDPGARRRYRFKHPTASGKTIAAAGFVDAARTTGVLILTHRRLLVDQFTRDLTKEGYGSRLHEAVLVGDRTPDTPPLTINTYSWFIKHASQLKADVYGVVVCDEAHTALGEKTSAAIRSLSEPVYIGMTATDQLLQKHVSDVFPGRGGRPPAGRGRAPRRGGAASLHSRAPDRLAAHRRDRRRRLRPGPAGRRARPRSPEHGRRRPLPEPLRRHAGHRLRGRRRPRRARGRGHEGDRAAGRRRLRPHAAPRPRRDAGRLRARRDQRAGERNAPGRGMERPPRHGLHAPRADRQPPRLPAAGRPHHAPPPPQGIGHRGRLRRARRAAHRARDHAALAARRRCLPAQRAGHAAAAAPPPLAPPAAEADRQGSLLDRPGLGQPRAADRGDRQPVAPGGCVQAADRRAAGLGGRRRPRRHAGRRAAAGRADRGAAARIAGAVPVHLRGREQAPQAAPGCARRPVLPAAQPDHLRDGLPAGGGGADLAAGPRARVRGCCCWPWATARSMLRSTGSWPGRGSWRGPPATTSTATRAPTSPTAAACWARWRRPPTTRPTPRRPRGWSPSPPPHRSRQALPSSPSPPRAATAPPNGWWSGPAWRCPRIRTGWPLRWARTSRRHSPRPSRRSGPRPRRSPTRARPSRSTAPSSAPRRRPCR